MGLGFRVIPMNAMLLGNVYFVARKNLQYDSFALTAMNDDIDRNRQSSS